MPAQCVEDAVPGGFSYPAQRVAFLSEVAARIVVEAADAAGRVGDGQEVAAGIGPGEAKASAQRIGVGGDAFL